MEGVEFTSSQPSGSNNASSLNQAVVQQPENNNGQGLCSSVHAPSHKENEPTVSTALDKSDKQLQQSWTIIGKAKQFQLFFPLEIIPGQNPTEKKNYVYQIISDVPGLRTYVVTTIKGIKVIKATYESEQSAQKVLERQIIEGNKVRFCKIEGINQAQDNQQSYEICIWDVPLDIEKDIFEQHLCSIGNVKSIKFNIKQLYYEVAVTFADNKLEKRFKKEWVIRFCKHVFRVFPSILSREERNHRFKYVLKLANLPSGTCAIDLAEIANITKAKAIFLPKNKFLRNYEKERFVWFYFDSEQEMGDAKTHKFSYNNKGLNFVDKNTITCHVCGSSFHKLRNCPENNKYQQAQRTHSVYQSIYKRYQVKAPTAKGDNWEDKQNSYANIAKMNSNQGSSNSNNPQSAAKQQQVNLVNNKGKQKENAHTTQRRPWNENAIQSSTADRLANVEVQILNSKAPSDTRQVSLSFGTVNETFKNSNNKRIRTMETMRDKEVDIFIRPTNVETQSREAALIETERITQMTATISPQTSTQQDSDMLVDVQETLDKKENERLDNFEKRMDSAFLSLSNMHYMFENFINKITPNSQDTSPNNGYKDTIPPNNSQ
ncbi:hypothetical protein RhiirA5_423232 [Rhizophagus irregularis]|uniref:CCHC-type domain-containing protein n=2 Tax=Rhizophagus irregularis TaxID=588596 RepID=A0A2N0PAD9_9GLOM|nr:hypothetical protein RhiirA5_423232 [Rhizophagus irregularis]